jgi:hypothetical protein
MSTERKGVNSGAATACVTAPSALAMRQAHNFNFNFIRLLHLITHLLTDEKQSAGPQAE